MDPVADSPVNVAFGGQCPSCENVISTTWMNVPPEEAEDLSFPDGGFNPCPVCGADVFIEMIIKGMAVSPWVPLIPDADETKTFDANNPVALADPAGEGITIPNPFPGGLS